MEDNTPNELQALKDELLDLIETMKRESDAINHSQMDRVLRLLGSIEIMTGTIDAHTLALKMHLKRIERLEALLGGGTVGTGQTADPQAPKNPDSPEIQGQVTVQEKGSQEVDYQARPVDQVKSHIEQIRNKSLNPAHRATFPPGSRPQG